MEEIIASQKVKNQRTVYVNPLAGKSAILTFIAVTVFLVLNALKITLFNYILTQTHTLGVFTYKLLMTFLLVVIFFFLVFRFKSRVLFISIYILQTLYIMVNITYYLYFHNYLHIVQSILLFTEAFSVTKNSAIPLNPLMLLALLDMPAVIYIVRNYSGTVALRLKYRFTLRIAVTVSLCVIIFVEIFNYSHNQSLFQITHDTFSGESPIVERYGTIVNNVISLSQNSNNKELINQLRYGSSHSQPASNEAHPNFVIIQVESMDADIVNQKYQGSYVTPFLHSLSNESVYYPYTLSYHEGGGTSDCEFSIINSVEALQYFPALKLSNYNFPNSMVSELSKAGYDTVAFHGNTGSFYNRDVAFPKLGFSMFYDMNKMNIPENGWGVPDNKVFDFALSKMKAVKQPFLSYVITMTSHEPFNSVLNYYKSSSYDSIKDETVKNYYNSFNYVDQSIEGFVKSIESSLKNTYIIIVGDHTPNINTDTYKQASFTMDGRYFEFVPLMVVTPDHKVYSEKSKVASILDIAPTILDESGIKFTIKSDGLDLTRPDSNYANIPFKGSSYNRTLLYNKANNSN